MISFLPLILAAEIVQHVIVIVLSGIVFTEYIRHRRLSIAGDVASHRKEIRYLLLACVFLAIWSSLRYFFTLDSIPFLLFVLAPAAFVNPILIWLALRHVWTRVMKIMFFALLAIVAAYLVLCVAIALFGFYASWMRPVCAVLELLGVFVFYFLALKYCVTTRQ